MIEWKAGEIIYIEKEGLIRNGRSTRGLDGQ